MFNCGFLFIQIFTHGKYNEGSEVVKTRFLNSIMIQLHIVAYCRVA